MRAVSSKYKGLRVSSAVGDVKFVAGEAEVSEAQAETLRNLPEDFGVTVEEAVPSVPSDPPTDPPGGDEGSSPSGDGTVLERPGGNASLEAWAAYATQEGHDVTGLKQSDIRALFSE